jgi:MFS family permease
MFVHLIPLFALLLAVAVMLLGNGLLGTLLGLRAGFEGFPPDLTGAVMSAYFGGFVVGSLAGPVLIARTGHIRAFAVLAAVAAAAAPLYAYLPHPLAWMALRFGSGLAVMGLYMVVESWLNSVAPRETRGRVFGTYMSVNLLAMAAAQGLVALAPAAGPGPFVAAGVLFTLSLVPVALTRLPEPARVPATPLRRGAFAGLPRLGLVTAFATGLVLGAFWGMGAVWAQRAGLGTGGVGAFMAATILGGALLQWPIGRWSDRHDRRRVLAATAAVGAGAALACALLTPLRAPWVVGVAAVYGGCAFALYSLGVAAVTDAVPAARIVEATRALLLVNGAGAALGPATVGYAMGVAPPGAFFAYAAAVLAVLALIALRARPSVPIEQQGHFTALARTSPAALELHPEGASPVAQAGVRGA